MGEEILLGWENTSFSFQILEFFFAGDKCKEKD